jgi:hypothetical protein
MKLIRPDSPYKLRDIDICIMLAKTRNSKLVAITYGLTKNRIMQIFRAYMSHLNEQLCNVPYATAIKNRRYYWRKEALTMLQEYKDWLMVNI